MDYLKLLIHSYNEQEDHGTRHSFLGSTVFAFVTYDDAILEQLTREALQTCEAISTQGSEYPYTDAWYTVMCNMPFFQGKLEWGTSIRGAWWDTAADYTLETSYFMVGDAQLLSLKLDVEQWKLFMKAMKEFIGD